jgi:hypothetical protein
MLTSGHAYSVDIIFSAAATSKPIVQDNLPVTMYQFRRQAQKKLLTLKASRQMLHDILSQPPDCSFHLDHYQNAARARMGIREMQQQGLLAPLPVIGEQNGELTVRRKFTFYMSERRMHCYPPFNAATARIRDVSFLAPRATAVIGTLQQGFFLHSKNKAKRAKQKLHQLHEKQSTNVPADSSAASTP